MIGYYPKSYTFFIITCGIFFTHYFFCCLNCSAKYIGIVIAIFLLQYPYQSFKAHTSIYMGRRQRLKAAIFFTIVLYKYIVPYFYYLWMIFIHQIFSGHQCPFCIWPTINMYFCTRATRAGITHFPKIIFFIAIHNFIGRY